MPRRIAISTLNASTIDILNVIRQNASLEYQSQVPTVDTEADIPKVGEILYGYPALSNQFINALINRIALVRIRSALFNNPYANLKKGYLELGETVEEVFVNITKAREFSVEKAEAREFKRSLPDVRTAFHAMNWRVQYPITIQQEDLKLAFTSVNGVRDLIEKIINAVYTAAEYDEYLLFKYLMIKAISKGKMHPVPVDVSDIHNSAIQFRGNSNKLTFMSSKYNAEGVTTTTPKSDQYIFMDTDFNAQYDVNVLAGAFNMEKADFIGKLKLIDDWTTFDNDRWDVIRAGCDAVEEVTSAELTLMQGVIAVLVDAEWFQVYDNLTNMSDKQVASGLYWNYFLNVWKTVSSSPFSNAIVFVANSATTTLPASITFTVADKSVSGETVVLTLEPTEVTAFSPQNYQFVQTEDATKDGIAIQRYGAIIFPDETHNSVVLECVIDGTTYTNATAIESDVEVGDTITLSK